MINYAELNDGPFTSLHTRLLKSKGGEDQTEFLHTVKDSEAFVEYMDQHVGSTGGDTADLFPGPLTEQSFREMTQDQEKTAYLTWVDVPPRVACRVSFWGKITLEHVRDEKVRDSFWLAMNGGRNESGEERIDYALASNEEHRARLIDDCVRTVIRRMSGLPAARGNRSVFVNPSFGRAWWRERIVGRITQRQSVESRGAILTVVRMNQQYWENLVTMIVSRGSVFGSVDVQDALINSLAKCIEDEPNSPLRSASTLMKAMRRISNVAASREMGVLAFEEIGEIIDDVLLSVGSSMAESSQS